MVVVAVIVVGGDLILADGELELVVVAEVVGVLMVAEVAGASVAGVGGGLMEVAVAAGVVVDMEEDLSISTTRFGSCQCSALFGVATPPVLEEWNKRAETFDNLTNSVRIAMVGKYVGLSDSYLSVVKVGYLFPFFDSSCLVQATDHFIF
ncbi:hypothetical protein Vadar_029515 [Vaccinium darrowii]|uniref:Uncharacterized protein n=1 Tax=Vaccinium darrowii TaxID=229202 RepID=A0ACB7Z6X6_9ERIC|nr:hypothetical protein Vadar_029515 [Vaccinium darrowii]